MSIRFSSFSLGKKSRLSKKYHATRKSQSSTEPALATPTLLPALSYTPEVDPSASSSTPIQVLSGTSLGSQDSLSDSVGDSTCTCSSSSMFTLSPLSLLMDILDDPRDTDVWRNFLCKEFIEELLDFYLAVDDWKIMWWQCQPPAQPSTKSLKKMRQRAVDLYTCYVRDDAPRCVNMPSDIKTKLDTTFHQIDAYLKTIPLQHDHDRQTSLHSDFTTTITITPTYKQPSSIVLPSDIDFLNQITLNDSVFDLAQQVVLEMMVNEPFVRFMETYSFRNLQLEQQKRARKGVKTMTRRQRLQAIKPIQFADLATRLDLYQIFENLLKKEYSEEYLYFWNDLLMFHQTRNTSMMKSCAQSLYERYIANEHVTISTTACNHVKKILEISHSDDDGRGSDHGIHRSMFDLVRFEIEAILKTKFFNYTTLIQEEMQKSKHAHK